MSVPINRTEYLGVIKGHLIMDIVVSDHCTNLAKLSLEQMKAHIYKLMEPADMEPDIIGHSKNRNTEAYVTELEEDLNNVVLYFKIEIKEKILTVTGTDFQITR
jgi:hypothetical protein